MKFDLPKDQASIIKVIGVGGGGSNAVNHMYNQGITGVDFVICNTDAQALDLSPVPNKIQLGTTLTEGLGAGADPDVGKNAAIEDVDAIKKVLENNTKMVFITAGMGGGTGTGAAPVIAEVARGMGILTVGIVTIPFAFEGRVRKQQAEEGLTELKNHVDTLLIINNDKLRLMYGNLKMSEAFAKADDVLSVAAKGISEIITVTGYVNTDFRDVSTVMKDGGTAIMGTGIAEGENRAIDAVSKALTSPLLDDSEIKGANYILLNITSGTEEITMDEIGEITDYIEDEAGLGGTVIWGNCTDETLEDKISVTVIATGFGGGNKNDVALKNHNKVILDLKDDVKTNITVSLDETEKPATHQQVEEPTLKSEKTTSPRLDFESPVLDNNQKMEPSKNPTPIKKEVERVVFKLEEDNDENISELTKKTIDKEITFVKRKENSIKISIDEKPVYTNKIPNEAQLKRSQERILKIKELGLRMKTPSGINDLENEPAYKRREINLNETAHSSENPISSFTLSSDDEGKTTLNDDNSFLHDNVD